MTAVQHPVHKCWITHGPCFLVDCLHLACPSPVPAAGEGPYQDQGECDKHPLTRTGIDGWYLPYSGFRCDYQKRRLANWSEVEYIMHDVTCCSHPARLFYRAMMIVCGPIRNNTMAWHLEARSCRDEQGQDANRNADPAGSSRPPTCGRKSDFIVWLQLHIYQRNLYKVGYRLMSPFKCTGSIDAKAKVVILTSQMIQRFRPRL